MTDGNKCFCERYLNCADNPDVTVQTYSGEITGAEFVRKAGMLCEGTTVHVANSKLAGRVAIHDGVIELPLDAVSLQCEYDQHVI